MIFHPRESSNLFFHILTKCNLSCGHCYINRAQHGETTRDPDTIENWLNIFAPGAARTNLVLLGGGEPTLHPHLARVIKTARQTNDGIRGKGCWDAVMSGIDQAVSIGFSCSMIYTVSEKNIHELDRMPKLVSGLGIDRFFIQVMGIRGESKASQARAQVDKNT